MNDNDALGDLVRRAATGDEAAIEQLLLDYYPDLEKYIERRFPAYIGRLVSVDDVIQETYARVFRDIMTFKYEGRESFLAWLHSIADNRIRDIIRAFNAQKRPDRLIISPQRDGDSSRIGDLVDLVSADINTASQNIGREEIVAAVQIATASLPEKNRLAIQLRHLEGKTVEEVADQMDLTTGAVRGLLQRGKEKLRDAVGRASAYLTSK